MTMAWPTKTEKYSLFQKPNNNGGFIELGIALLENRYMKPANKIGFIENGGPYNLWQLKVMTLVVFTVLSSCSLKIKHLQLTILMIFAF